MTRSIELWIVLALAAACAASTTPDPSGETHFLTQCDGGCGNGLACICGVCTRACAQSSECEPLAAGARALRARAATRRPATWSAAATTIAARWAAGTAATLGAAGPRHRRGTRAAAGGTAGESGSGAADAGRGGMGTGAQGGRARAAPAVSTVLAPNRRDAARTGRCRPPVQSRSPTRDRCARVRWMPPRSFDSDA